MSKGKTIWAFVISYLFTGTAYGLETILIPVYALSLKASTQELGLIQAGLGLGLLIMAIPSGFLVQKYGSRKPYILCGFSMTVIMLAMSQLKQPLILVIAVTIASAVSTINMISVNAAFYSSLGKLGKSKTGWHKGSLAIGLALIGPLTGGFVINNYGFFAAFFLISLLWLVPAVLAAVFIKPNRKTDRNKANLDVVFPKAKELLSNRLLLNGAVLEGIGIAILVIFSTFVAALSLKELSLGPQHVGLFLSLEGIAYALVLFLGGNLLVVFRRKTLVLISFLSSALAFTIFGSLANFAAIAIASALLGFALGLLGLNSTQALANVDIDKGSVAGFHGLTMGVFNLAGPLTAGYIGNLFGLKAIFWLVVILNFVLIFSALLSRLGQTLLFVEEVN